MKAEMTAVQRVDLQFALWVVWRAVTKVGSWVEARVERRVERRVGMCLAKMVVELAGMRDDL